MNLDAFPRICRPRLDGEGLEDLIPHPSQLPDDPDERIAELAKRFEAIPQAELTGLVQDMSQIAGELNTHPYIRSLAARVARLCEGVLETGLASWDDLAMWSENGG